MLRWTLGLLITLSAATAHAKSGDAECASWVLSNMELAEKLTSHPIDGILDGAGLGRKPAAPRVYRVFNEATDKALFQQAAQFKSAQVAKMSSADRTQYAASMIQGFVEVLKTHEPDYLKSCNASYERQSSLCAAYDRIKDPQKFASCMADFWQWNKDHTPLQKVLGEESRLLQDGVARSTELQQLIKTGKLEAIQKFTDQNPAHPFIRVNALYHAAAQGRIDIVQYFLGAHDEYLYNEAAATITLKAAEKNPEIYALIHAKIPETWKKSQRESCRRILKSGASRAAC